MVEYRQLIFGDWRVTVPSGAASGERGVEPVSDDSAGAEGGFQSAADEASRKAEAREAVAADEDLVTSVDNAMRGGRSPGSTARDVAARQRDERADARDEAAHQRDLTAARDEQGDDPQSARMSAMFDRLDSRFDRVEANFDREHEKKEDLEAAEALDRRVTDEAAETEFADSVRNWDRAAKRCHDVLLRDAYTRSADGTVGRLVIPDSAEAADALDDERAARLRYARALIKCGYGDSIPVTLLWDVPESDRPH
jgi:hypothetical protein